MSALHLPLTPRTMGCAPWLTRHDRGTTRGRSYDLSKRGRVWRRSPRYAHEQRWRPSKTEPAPVRQPPPRWPQNLKSSAARRTLLSPLPKRWLRLVHGRRLGGSGRGRQSRRPVQPARRLRRVRAGLPLRSVDAATDASRRSQQLVPRAAAPEVASSCMAARLGGRRDTSSSETRASKPPRADGEQRARGAAQAAPTSRSPLPLGLIIICSPPFSASQCQVGNWQHISTKPAGQSGEGLI